MAHGHPLKLKRYYALSDLFDEHVDDISGFDIRYLNIFVTAAILKCERGIFLKNCFRYTYCVFRVSVQKKQDRA